MNVIKGAVRFDGSGPKNSRVEILATDGTLLGTTTSDVHGNFCVDHLDVDEGQHEVIARCTAPSGKVTESSGIEIEVQASDDSWDEAIEHFRDEARQQAEQQYIEIVEARAAGENIDPEYGNALLEATGRTMYDFEADVQTVSQINDMEARSVSCAERMAALREYAAWWGGGLQ